jgi:hypothetical protein
MGHCSGGDGPNTFDPVAALDQWVENGKSARRHDGFAQAASFACTSR